jgi:S1-C subfamily serine protease
VNGIDAVPPAFRRIGLDPLRRIRRARRDPRLGYDSRAGTLQIVALARDNLTEQPLLDKDGRRIRALLHENDSADLALLRAQVAEPVDALPLRGPDARVETLEPVLVLGFPDGPDLLERGRATPTASVGEVSKVEDSLLINAPLVGGSSGGPVIDAEGRVIGIVSRRLVGSAFGRCIQAHHLQVLGGGHGLGR